METTIISKEGKKVRASISWEHFRSRRPGYKVTQCTLITDTDEESIETTSLVKTSHASKDTARKQALHAALIKTIPTKDMRRQVWEAYLRK